MRRYDGLLKRIDKIEKAMNGLSAPYMAFIKEIEGGYELSISFWDGKEGSGDLMPPNMICQFSFIEMLEDFLISYLKEHKPKDKFVVFCGEDEIEN